MVAPLGDADRHDLREVMEGHADRVWTLSAGPVAE